MKLFSLDSPIMVFMTKVANLMILNFLMIICCIPIITGGASITAMYYVTLKMARDEDPYIFKNFVKSFKQNFKQSTIIWVILLVVVYALYMDWKIVTMAMTGNMAKVMEVAMIVIIVLAAMIALYVFPVLSRFDNTVRATIKNAFLMSIINLPKTIWMLLIHLIPMVAILITNNAVPVVFMLGFSTVAYLCSRTFVKIFKKFEPEEEELHNGDEYVPLSFMVEEEEARKEALRLEESAAAAADAGEEPAADTEENMDPAAEAEETADDIQETAE